MTSSSQAWKQPNHLQQVRAPSSRTFSPDKKLFLGMWARREPCPSYPQVDRPRRPRPAFDRRGTNGAARCCTTRRLNAHITSEQRVLYDWHPWAGRIVTVHSVLDKASDSVARCSLAREATGLPLEVPLWMFDRMMCSSARREHHPQVVITALADLQALLAEVTGAGRVDPRIASTDSVLSADLMSRDPNQGEVDAPSSYKASPVRAVRSGRTGL